jgi:hypothetical protein
MKQRLILGGVVGFLLAVTASVFLYPHQMIAPGALIPAHAQLEQNCFACHAPLQGVSSERCITCHKPSQIGLTNTTGQSVRRRFGTPMFHAQLKEANCTSCHTDHAKAPLTHGKLTRFNHSLLKPGIAGLCAICHTKPKDQLHKAVTTGCTQCHTANAWTPATFAHDRYFRLDGDHNVACATCHTGGTFATYTCYGCHEHQEQQLIREHAGEGIHNINNCVRCHKSSREMDGEEKNGERDD